MDRIKIVLLYIVNIGIGILIGYFKEGYKNWNIIYDIE